jgi:hypothetical protein
MKRIQRSTIVKNFVYILPVLYVIAVSVYMLWHRAWLSPDQFFGFAIIAVIFLGKTKQFLQDWVPVLLLLFGYEYLRGLVPILSKSPHIFPLINADLTLFGFLPTIKLQSLLFTDNVFRWYDYIAVVLYIGHFVIPMIIAFILWLYDRKYFKQYTTAFLVLSYMAFFTYIVYPAMPPWMASDLGYIPPLKKIMDQVLASFAHPISVPSVYKFFGANLVAAMPSVHAAYPWLIFLFIAQKYRKFTIFAGLYVAGVWFSIVYLGEHYVIDVIAGCIYATVAYIIVHRIYTSHQSVALSDKE